MVDLGFVHEHVAGADTDAPALLCLHGTGGGEGQLLPLAARLAGDAPVIAPRGHVVEGDGVPRFFRRIPVPGDTSAYPFTFDDADVAARADELAAFVAAATDHYGLGDRPLVALGFSNGANMAAALMLLHPGVLRAAILLAPMPVLSDPPDADLSNAAALLTTGRTDPIATPGHAEQLAGQLDERGAAVELHLHPGGHEAHPESIAAAHTWLTKLRRAIAIDPLP